MYNNHQVLDSSEASPIGLPSLAMFLPLLSCLLSVNTQVVANSSEGEGFDVKAKIVENIALYNECKALHEKLDDMKAIGKEQDKMLEENRKAIGKEQDKMLEENRKAQEDKMFFFLLFLSLFFFFTLSCTLFLLLLQQSRYN
nr:hypothetical protein Iba_chr01cCG6650 [Ipomoea batatas]GMC55450.1 hypothetical protein Iba_chr01eCG7530 [Ipomoea batatas]